MDPETGESQTEPETGEKFLAASVDNETGEQEYPDLKAPKRPFRVPREFTISKVPVVRQKPFKSSEKRIEFLTAVLFLVPSMIFFYPVLGLPILVLEVLIHGYCHALNKRLKDERVFYRSPLHLITNEFCGNCKVEASNHKITKIQDIRNDNRLRKYGLDIRNVVT